MSPVVTVTIPTTKGSIRTVLKLYDRRFGKDLRDVYNTLVPHTKAREAAFHSFIRRGMMAPFLRELEEDDETETLPSNPSAFLDSSEESPAKFEAILWKKCNEYYASETEAYAQLRDLQGTAIPRMLAHVDLVQPDSGIPEDLRQEACYFAVKGVLLEYIDGYNLGDINTSSLAPSDPKEWSEIIQLAVNTAHEINKRGIIMMDSAPRNVVVDGRSQIPFLIDFAQCVFKDKLIRLWKEEWEWDEDENWNPDLEYWEQACGRGDPAAIGLIMKMRLQKKGVDLWIKYPDYNQILEDIKRSKAADERESPRKDRENTEPRDPEEKAVDD